MLQKIQAMINQGMWYKFDITINTKLNYTIISLTQIENEIEIEKNIKEN